MEDILVPISFFLLTFGIVFAVSAHRYRIRKVIQEERMRSMELRIPLQPEPQRTQGNPYIMPLLLIGSGLGLMLLYLECYNSGDAEGRMASLGFGSILLLGGLGWLVAIRMNRASRERMERLAEMETQAYVAALEQMSHVATVPSATVSPAPVPPAPPASPGSRTD